jgi:hypothetical protein
MRKRFLAAGLAGALLAAAGTPVATAGKAPLQAQGATLSGTATSSIGETLGNMTVRVRDLSSGQLAGTTTSSPTGTFTFAGLPAGTYAIEVVTATGTIVGTSASITVAAGATVTGVTVSATAAAAGAAAGAGAAAAGAAVAGGAGAAGISTAVIVTTVAVAAGVAGAVAIAANASPSR